MIATDTPATPADADILSDPRGDLVDSLTDFTGGAASQEAPIETPPSADPVAPEAPAVVAKEDGKAAVEAPKTLAELLDEEEAEVPKDEKKAEPEEPIPDFVKGQKAQAEWTRLHKVEKAAKLAESRHAAELNELRKVKDADPVRGELEAKIRENEDLATRLARLDVRESEAYRKEITAPLDREEKIAIALGAAGEISADKILDAAYQPDPAKYKAAMTEILENLPVVDQVPLVAAVNRIRDLAARGYEIQNNAKPALAEAKQREQEAAEKVTIERKAVEMREVSDTVAKMKSKLGEMLTVEGGASLETVIAEISATAQAAAFGDLKVREQATAVSSLAVMPYLIAHAKAQKATIESLRRQLGGAANVQPKAGVVAETRNDHGDDNDSDPMGSAISGLLKGIPGLG